MADWTDKELAATVSAYLKMLAAEKAGKQYAKASYRRDLRAGPLRNRSAASIEYRMRNISAVLEEHGRDWVKGYRPADHVGPAVSSKLWNLIREYDGNGRESGRKGMSTRPKQPPIIYFNIGWMKEYAGIKNSDPTIGGHGYLVHHDHGAEAFNFLPKGGVVQGYRPGHERGVEVSKLGAPRGADRAEGVLVVWLAKEPITKATVVVGWYKNATVYRRSRHAGRTVNGEAVLYTVEASARDAVLLPLIARNFQVGSARLQAGGFGQSPIWYGTDSQNRRVWNYVCQTDRNRSSDNRTPQKTRRPGRAVDPELRRKIEQAAVQHAWEYFESAEGGSYKVVSREAEGCGWDLDAERTDEILHIEVKGRGAADVVCELTPNEYAMMRKASIRDRYVIYVVCNALAETPLPSVFWHQGDGVWETLDGRQLTIEEKTAAILRCG